MTPAAWGVPKASEREGKSQVAHKWAKWLHNPCHLVDTQCFGEEVKIRSGPQVGGYITSAT